MQAVSLAYMNKTSFIPSAVIRDLVFYFERFF